MVNGTVVVKVVRSFLKDINVGDELVTINHLPAIDFITDKMRKYIKSTYSYLTAVRKYVLFMTI